MSKNEYILEKDYAILRIHSKKSGTIDSRIDKERIESLSRVHWRAVYEPTIKSYRVLGCVTKKLRKLYARETIPIHQYLMWTEYQNSPGLTADHLNRDPLDNRLCNLQMKSRTQQNLNQNIQANNRSGFRGVSINSRNKTYRVDIACNKVKRNIGTFKEAELAAAAYNLAATILHKSDAQLNPTTAILSEDQIAKIKTKLL